MITVEEKQKLALEDARSQGFGNVAYLGEVDRKSVYQAGTDNTRATGLPYFVEVDEDGNVAGDFGFKYMYLVKDEK